MLLEKDQLNTIEFLVCQALIGSYICRDEFVSVSNVFREYNKMKKEIKNLKLQWNTLYENG